jgi:glucose/arabinose dehydrogenase
MTDFSLPGRQVGAQWKSGNPTLAISGATWLTGKRWQGYRGRLVLAALKNSSVRLLRFAGNDFRGMVTPPALDGDFGRLRTAVVGPRNALYFTTDNGADNDRILKVTPR